MTGAGASESRYAGHGVEYFETRAAARARTRLGVLCTFVFMAFAMLGVRLTDLTLAAQAESTGVSSPTPVAARHRAELMDRNGRLLAQNVDNIVLAAQPRDVWDAVSEATAIREVLPDLDEATLVRRLSRRDLSEIYLAWRLTPQQRYDIHSRGLPGIVFREEERRLYPHRNSLAHLVGYASDDGEGRAGLELGLNSEIQAAREPLSLSVDLRVQHALRDELMSAMEEFSAQAAAGVVMNVNTGEVLGMVSLPDFDPHQPGDPSSTAYLNRASGATYDLGSVVKPLTIAHALDLDIVTPETIFDVSGPYEVASHRIRDFHHIPEPIDVREILAESSNIGTAQIAALIGRDRQRDLFAEMGLLDRLDVEIAGAARPIVPENWGPLETATISFGHGLTLSPLHLAAATAATVNGGWLVEPTFVRRAENARVPRRRIFSEETSDTMRDLLRYVVTDGTGGNADVPGYEVAGKTGTAEKPRPGGGYDRNRLISSFVAVFPASEPEIIVFALLDEPSGTRETGGYATGGATVAPAVGRIVERIAPFVGVLPTDMEARSQLAANEAAIVTLSPQ